MGVDALQVQSIDQDQLGQDDGAALEEGRLPAIISQGLHIKQCGLEVGCRLGKKPFKVGEKGRIVERPLGRVLVRV